ncbi:spore wall protein 2-like [Vicia villosa]|uniref:spore wall protein 2-like n=1 Tax=Vicia villosa TaxID=3911 RepID=UPI00273B9A9D|nr:spore wall protein 2-like [Vicia villosa]
MFSVPPSSKLKEDEKFYFNLVKWCLDGDVTKLNWEWDVDYISYIELEKLIHEVGHTSLKCIWYVNPRFSFARGLTAIENDRDILRFAKDVEGFDVMDVNVEHDVDIPDIVYEEELGKDGNLAKNVAEGDPTVEVDNMDKGVTNVEAENVAEGDPTVEVDNMAEGDPTVEVYNMTEDVTNVEVDNMTEGDNNVEGENVGEGENMTKGDNNVDGENMVEGENMIEGDDNVEGKNVVEGDSDDGDFVGDSNDDSIDLDWTIVLPTNTSAI